MSDDDECFGTELVQSSSRKRDTKYWMIPSAHDEETLPLAPVSYIAESETLTISDIGDPPDGYFERFAREVLPLATSLRYIDISRCDITCDAVIEMAKTFERHPVHLKSIFISKVVCTRCAHDRFICTPRLSTAFFRALRRNSVLLSEDAYWSVQKTRFTVFDRLAKCARETPPSMLDMLRAAQEFLCVRTKRQFSQ